MRKTNNQEILNRKDEPIVKKSLKQIKINRIIWTVASSVCFLLAILMIVLATTVFKNQWNTWSKVIAISIPTIITILSTVMTILVYLGNKIDIKMYKNDKITFYSGPWTNVLYINDKLIYKGSSEQKMVGTLSDNSVCKIKLGTTKFSIDILPQGSDALPTEQDNKQK